MKVLVFMSHGLIARNFEWVLRELAGRGHRVHVALDQAAKNGATDTTSLLSEIASECPDVSVGPAPPRDLAGLPAAGRAFRLMLDYVRYLEPGYADVDKPRKRIEAALPPALRWLAVPLLRTARGRAVVRAGLGLADAGVPPGREVRDFVSRFDPDVMLVTPLVDAGSPQTDYVRSARRLGIPCVLPVHSWDNLTVKGGLYEIPDVVAVWNAAQREEAINLHGVPRDRIVRTGAVAYDHWFAWTPSSSRMEFCESVGLDPDHPFVLYLGSSRFIAPDESEFFAAWHARVRDSATLPHLQVLARPHPLNRFSGASPPGVAVVDVHPTDPSDRASRAAYFDAIHHSTAVMGVLTSGMIEAAIVGRPVHTLQAERYRDSQARLRHFRHLLPENGGMLIVGRSFEENATQLGRSLAGEPSSRNAPFVASFVRSPDSSRSSSTRFVDVIERGIATRANLKRSPPMRVLAAVMARAGWMVFRVGVAIRRRCRADVSSRDD